MLRYRTSGVGSFSAHYVGAWWPLARHHPHRVTCLLALHHGHTVRRASMSHLASSERAKNTGNWEPQLRRLAVVRPDLVDEWVPELNDTDVSSVPCTSQIPVWWCCAACGENYQATVRERAVLDKGCPRCSLERQSQHLQHTNRSDRSVVEGAAASSGNGGAPSLAETHQLLASRWDHEKNGLLRPTDVTSTSELNVWWRPAEGRPAHERSFRRPVYAFVEVPYSMEEQREAQARMELDILQQIRRAAKIAEARERNTFPAAETVLDDIVSTDPNSAAAVPTTQESQGQELEGEDFYKAIELWERSLDVKINADCQPLFQFTKACDWGEVSREQVLTTYNEFVMGHKEQNRVKEGSGIDPQHPQPVASDAVPSVITDPDWVKYFTLSVDEVSKDCFAASARLVFSGMVSSLKPPQSAEEGAEATEGKRDEAAGRRCRADSLPPPPEEYESEIRTTFAFPKQFYPRRPQMPPHREDDLMESFPKATEATPRQPASSKGETDKGRRGSLSNDLPAEASFEALTLAGTQSLLQEYTFPGDKDVPFDADEPEVQQQSLLGKGVLQPMTNDEVQALQYNRGTPRPRRTGRFRLRPPDDVNVRRGAGLRPALGVSLSPTADEAEGKQQQVIQAPGTPRKVARPKKKCQETAETTNAASGTSSAEEAATSLASA
ncbi:hypothetical protein TraAM80_03303 [Trypanosoma rangeli]|uniref:Treble clef zinc finger domain-containing protein n=1 Tax=Trypanosoma rangeli TaxID=5698 RepID=A0A3R7M1N2_TRYRA|nr:uncharacterized protein TraAM80_03303 [Trypanosoma rangeli]RNF07391.1 hypothetical protein TraAM80_03303 [Trypanosoma rangeli]|eukprot:RNF07391.1 hypothetical protein TraAM80_03303 [Trypanosoma rangeli]